jgi:hypothetical protein
MSFFTEHRELYVYDRTIKQLEPAKQYVDSHPEKASAAVAALVVAAVYFPGPVILALAVGIFALLAFNALKEPSFLEDQQMQAKYHFN